MFRQLPWVSSRQGHRLIPLRSSDDVAMSISPHKSQNVTHFVERRTWEPSSAGPSARRFRNFFNWIGPSRLPIATTLRQPQLLVCSLRRSLSRETHSLPQSHLQRRRTLPAESLPIRSMTVSWLNLWFAVTPLGRGSGAACSPAKLAFFTIASVLRKLLIPIGMVYDARKFRLAENSCKLLQLLRHCSSFLGISALHAYEYSIGIPCLSIPASISFQAIPSVLAVIGLAELSREVFDRSFCLERLHPLPRESRVLPTAICPV
jgi:hypothetical protein